MGNSKSDLTVPDFSHIEKRRESAGKERVLSDPLPHMKRRSSNPIPAPKYDAPQLMAVPKQKGFMRSKSDGALPAEKKQKGRLAATGFKSAKSAETIGNSRNEIEPFMMENTSIDKNHLELNHSHLIDMDTDRSLTNYDSIRLGADHSGIMRAENTDRSMTHYDSIRVGNGEDDAFNNPKVEPTGDLDFKADEAGDGTIHESTTVDPTAPFLPNQGLPKKQPPPLPPIVTIDPSAPPAYEEARAMSPLPKTQEAIDWVSQLKDLNTLHKEGALSDEEFKKAKDKLLAKKPSTKDEEEVREDFVE